MDCTRTSKRFRSSKKASAEARRSTQAARSPTSIVTPSAVIVASATKRLRLPRIVRRMPLPKALGLLPRPTTRYHSISAMGLGLSLTVMLVTRPLLKRMRRSAMSARAALCVTMITVIFSERHMS